jgi:hypothetical protein
MFTATAAGTRGFSCCWCSKWQPCPSARQHQKYVVLGFIIVPFVIYVILLNLPQRFFSLLSALPLCLAFCVMLVLLFVHWAHSCFISKLLRAFSGPSVSPVKHDHVRDKITLDLCYYITTYTSNLFSKLASVTSINKEVKCDLISEVIMLTC